MKTYFALFLTAACSSLVLTPVLRRLCERYRLVDAANDERKIHRQAVPRLGGVAIFLSMLLALASLLLLRNLLTHTLRADAKSIAVILFCVLLVLLLGAYDDVRGASAAAKFVGLAVLALLFYALGGRIEGLSVPFVGQITLHPV